MHVIAVDLGASNGRVMKSEYHGDRFTLEEVHRYPNTPVTRGKSIQWNIQQLWRETIKGVEWALDGAQSIGIDTWGVDFGLLDAQGNLLEDPVHYRDPRTDVMMEWVFKWIPRREIFNRTGIQFLQLNTLYQLASLVKGRKKILRDASTYLGFPDLFNFWLTGEKRAEYTHATTTQCYNPVKQDWDHDILEAVKIPIDLFPEIVKPGRILGTMKGVNVSVPACHDTGSAVVAVPTTEREFCYISSGTWSLIGTEIKAPIIDDNVYECNFTNEGGVDGTTRLLRNVPGFWFEQELIREWEYKGETIHREDLYEKAEYATPFTSIIDTRDPRFMAPGDMTSRIIEYCNETGQQAPQSIGEHIRCIYESMALSYIHTLGQLEFITGKKYSTIHMIGGGSRNGFVNQMTADALGRTVVAGPGEATALGNTVMQYQCIGLLGDIWEARKILSESLSLETYYPRSGLDWDTAYRRYLNLIME